MSHETTGPAKLSMSRDNRVTVCVCVSMLIPIIYLCGRRERKQSIMVCLLVGILFVKADKGEEVFVVWNWCSTECYRDNPPHPFAAFFFPFIADVLYHFSIPKKEKVQRSAGLFRPLSLRLIADAFTWIGIMWRYGGWMTSNGISISVNGLPSSFSCIAGINTKIFIFKASQKRSWNKKVSIRWQFMERNRMLVSEPLCEVIWSLK